MEKAKTANRYSAEVRSRAVRMVLEHGADHASQWASLSVNCFQASSTDRAAI
jgi:transposase-like protein